MNKHRVKAFTLMEITVTMLISAIVIGITYAAYLIVSQSYISYHKKSEDLEQLAQFDHLLRKDFVHADSIFKIQDGILFKIGPDSIVYNFQPDFVVRTSGITDTFKCQSQEMNSLFEDQPIDKVNVQATQNLIDELRLRILFNDEKITYHYYKQYSSENLIERIPNAVN